MKVNHSARGDGLNWKIEVISKNQPLSFAFERFFDFKYLEIRCRFTHPGLAYRHVRIVVNFHHFVVDVTNLNFHVFVCHCHGYSVDCLQPPS